MNKTLSIAIPTYNRKNIVYNNVKHILKSKCNNIEVVVVDNASDDGTYEQLLGIDDSRLSIYKNTENIGFTRNYYEVLDKAKSDFVFVMSDEDVVNLKLIESLSNTLKYKDDLLKKKIGAIIFNKDKNGIISQNQIIKIFSTKYMSGILINKSILKKIEYINEETLYPHICILLKLFNVSHILSSKYKFYEYGERGTKTHIQSYIKPMDRYNQFIEETSYLKDIKISTNLKIDLVLKLYESKFLNMNGFNTLIRNDKYREYYKLENDHEYDIDYENCIKIYNDGLKKILNDNFNFNDIKLLEDYIQSLNSRVRNVVDARKKFDYLKDKEYKICMLSQAYNKEYIKKSGHFKIIIDDTENKFNSGEKVLFIIDKNKNYEFEKQGINDYDTIYSDELFSDIDWLYDGLEIFKIK